MKKPKKTIAAKPLSRRTTSTRIEPGAKGAKLKAAAAPKKSAVKKTQKTQATAAEAAPPSESQSVAAAKSSVEAKSPLEVKRAKAKAVAAIEPLAKAKPPAKVKQAKVKAVEPISATATPAEISRSAKLKRAAKIKTSVQTKSPIETKPPVESQPVTEVKPPAAIPRSANPVPEITPVARGARKAPARIPAILFEGDRHEAPHVSGPGQRYALGPTAPVEKFKTEGELPESYGTGAILLTARDPHWLYTHWDLSGDQQRRYNAFSRDGHMVVRVYINAPGGKPATEVHVHPESRHWFVHVTQANARYVAELGYYSAADRWTVVSTFPSRHAHAAGCRFRRHIFAEFGTIPFEVPMEKLLSLVKEAVQENAPLAQALQELRANGYAGLPHFETTAQTVGEPLPIPWAPSEWTPAQERALAQVVSMDHVRRVWMGSLEITELIRRQIVQELASAAAAELGAPLVGAPTSPTGAVTGISSPVTKPAGQPQGFWFNVNAELIVYGATETDATVTIGGRRIKLRADGSFSYRFALPDGKYEMPVVAISADQTDGRAAEMKFSRETEIRGDVGAHPQDPALQQLILENF